MSRRNAPPSRTQIDKIANLRKQLGLPPSDPPHSAESAKRTIKSLNVRLHRRIQARKGQGTGPRRTTAGGTRLTSTAVPSVEINQRRAKARKPSSVTTRWVEPTPRAHKTSTEPASEAQQRTIAWLARAAGVNAPPAQTRHEATVAIGRLRAAIQQQGGKDPMAPSKRRRAAAARTKR